jgi:mRNA interferase MazF
MTTNASPSRGDVWKLDLNPAKGHEQSGFRPALVVSNDTFNHGPAGLVVVVPLTSKQKAIPLRVPIPEGEGGLAEPSFALIEAVRSVSKTRLNKRMGTVTSATLRQVEDHLKILLDL